MLIRQCLLRQQHALHESTVPLSPWTTTIMSIHAMNTKRTLMIKTPSLIRTKVSMACRISKKRTETAALHFMAAIDCTSDEKFRPNQKYGSARGSHSAVSTIVPKSESIVGLSANSQPLSFRNRQLHSHSGSGRHSHHGHSHNYSLNDIKKATQDKDAVRITNLGLASNLGLMVGKAVVGVLYNSTALLADAIHSLSDMLSDFVTLWTIKMARLPPDENHPYGHGKFEALGALTVGALLVAAGGSMGYHGVEQILSLLQSGETHSAHNHLTGEDTSTTLWLVSAAMASVIIKEVLYQMTIRIGKRNNSKVLIANAWHHRADSISSGIALAGILGAAYGYPALDPAAGVAVSALIMRMGLGVCWDSVRELTDEAVQSEVLAMLSEAVSTVPDVMAFRNVRARRMGPYSLVDLHIQVDSRMSVSAAQQVATKVKLMIMRKCPDVSEALVYVDCDVGNGSPQDKSRQFETPPHIDKLMRPQDEIMHDIRQALRSVPEVVGASHAMIHWQEFGDGPANEVEVQIVVDPLITVEEAGSIAEKTRRAITSIHDINEANVHLELGENDHAKYSRQWMYCRER